MNKLIIRYVGPKNIIIEEKLKQLSLETSYLVVMNMNQSEDGIELKNRSTMTISTITVLWLVQ